MLQPLACPRQQTAVIAYPVGIAVRCLDEAVHESINAFTRIE